MSENILRIAPSISIDETQIRNILRTKILARPVTSIYLNIGKEEVEVELYSHDIDSLSSVKDTIIEHYRDELESLSGLKQAEDEDINDYHDRLTEWIYTQLEEDNEFFEKHFENVLDAEEDHLFEKIMNKFEELKKN